VQAATIRKGFTLIELLIVVAIIAILAAIAVPNFLEAQTRAKVSRCKSDMRTLALAIEAYNLDNNMPPSSAGNGSGGVFRPYAVPPRTVFNPTSNLTIGFDVTTPIAYLTGISSLRDPFKEDRAGVSDITGRVYYGFINYQWLEKLNGNTALPLVTISKPFHGQWVLYGCGPDKATSNIAGSKVDYSSIANVPGGGDDLPLRVSYDPSNGTLSHGDIIRSQKHSELTPQFPI